MNDSRRILCITVIVALQCGCRGVTWSYSPDTGWTWVPTEAPPDTMVDQAWRAGGGTNNPNPQRLREGKPPLNFDGSVYRP